MIEQTDLIVSEWQYHPPAGFNDLADKMLSFTSLDVMKKRASTKKRDRLQVYLSFCYWK